jgi:hypothetical protein
MNGHRLRLLQPHSSSPERGYPSRNGPQARHAEHDSHWKWDAHRSARLQSLDDSLLLRRLKALHEPRHSLTAPLNFRELALLNTSDAQGLDQDIGGFDCIGDRAVDAYSSHRQHDVSGVAEQQQSRTVPPPQPVRLD